MLLDEALLQQGLEPSGTPLWVCWFCGYSPLSSLLLWVFLQPSSSKERELRSFNFNLVSLLTEQLYTLSLPIHVSVSFFISLYAGPIPQYWSLYDSPHIKPLQGTKCLSKSWLAAICRCLWKHRCGNLFSESLPWVFQVSAPKMEALLTVSVQLVSHTLSGSPKISPK